MAPGPWLIAQVGDLAAAADRHSPERYGSLRVRLSPVAPSTGEGPEGEVPGPSPSRGRPLSGRGRGCPASPKGGSMKP